MLGGSYLRYYAHRKMIAAKMVFVGFLGGGKAKIWGGTTAPRPAVAD